MKISAKVGASIRLYMKKFHKSQRDPNPSRRVNPGLEKGYPARRVDPGWLLRSCKYLLQVDRRRVDPLRRVEANPGSCKGGPNLTIQSVNQPYQQLSDFPDTYINPSLSLHPIQRCLKYITLLYHLSIRQFTEILPTKLIFLIVACCINT